MASQGCGRSRTTRIRKFIWNPDGTPNFGTPVSTGAALTVPSGEPAVTFHRVTNRHSGKVIDIQQPNTRDRARIGQWASNGAPWQQWRFVDAGGGYYRIESLHSGKCLDVLDLSTADGASVIQFRCWSGANQQFQLVPSGSCFTLRARHSGKCLNVAGSSTADGAVLEQRTCGTATSFQWSRS